MLDFYRLTHHNPPTVDDFYSYVELGKPILSGDTDLKRKAEGVSVYKTAQQARKAAGRWDYLGEFIAVIRIPDDDPAFKIEQTSGRTGHHTVWVHPDYKQAHELLARVISVEPVD